MKKKDELCKSIEQVLRTRANDQRKTRKDVIDLCTDSGMTIEICSDFISGRIDVETANDFQLYHLMAYYQKIHELTTKETNYYSKSEIDKYSKTKYEVKEIKFPIRISAIPVTQDQWIGVTSVKQLMEFRDAQLIYYNENTQRTLQRIIDGSVQFFKIMLNKTAVESIRGLLKKELFIPNTITLNIPQEDVGQIHYDEATKELVISEIDHFDIIDGYHRYIALSNEYNINKAFDYPMELRIVCFEETKAQQFIHQEDQKTEMKRLDSDAYNQNDLGNIICQRLNENSNLRGMIGLNNAIINKGVMRRFIDLYLGQKGDNKKILEYTKMFRDKYNNLVENNPNLLDKEWSWQFIAATVVAIMHDIDDIEAINALTIAIENDKHTASNTSKKALERLVKEVS